MCLVHPPWRSREPKAPVTQRRARSRDSCFGSYLAGSERGRWTAPSRRASRSATGGHREYRTHDKRNNEALLVVPPTRRRGVTFDETDGGGASAAKSIRKEDVCSRNNHLDP